MLPSPIAGSVAAPLLGNTAKTAALAPHQMTPASQQLAKEAVPKAAQQAMSGEQITLKGSPAPKPPSLYQLNTLHNLNQAGTTAQFPPQTTSAPAVQSKAAASIPQTPVVPMSPDKASLFASVSNAFGQKAVGPTEQQQIGSLALAPSREITA